MEQQHEEVQAAGGGEVELDNETKGKPTSFLIDKYSTHIIVDTVPRHATQLCWPLVIQCRRLNFHMSPVPIRCASQAHTNGNRFWAFHTLASLAGSKFIANGFWKAPKVPFCLYY